MSKNQYRIAYYACLFASALVSYISIQTSMDTMGTGKPPMSTKQSPSVPLHLFEFALAIVLVCAALYFLYKAYRDDDKKKDD